MPAEVATVPELVEALFPAEMTNVLNLLGKDHIKYSQYVPLLQVVVLPSQQVLKYTKEPGCGGLMENSGPQMGHEKLSFNYKFYRQLQLSRHYLDFAR